MLVFIDESGDPGIGTGSQYLVIAMVIFQTTQDASNADALIEEVRQTGHHKREFKFSQIKPETRDRFFATLSPRLFGVKAVIWDMHQPLQLSSSGREILPEIAYQMALNKLLHLTKLRQARIRIDGKSSRRMNRVLALQKQHLNSTRADTIQTIGVRDSQQDNLVQLADMVAGAIARSLYPDKKHHNRWRRMLKLGKSDLHYE